MAQRAVLALDQGTTNTKALLVGEDGSILASASRPTGVSYPREGWAEQPAEAIWASSAEVLKQVAAKAGGREIAALGISNQRESVVIWDAETGEPLGPCVIWQCLRSAPLVADIRSRGHAERVREESGLPLDPMLSAGKLRWLLDHVPDAMRRIEAGTLRAGTVDSWLVWNLTGGAVHATDQGNASRTQLVSLAGGDWSETLCELFGIPRAILPEVLASDSRFGVVAPGIQGVPAGVPIRAVMGDSHAALYAHGIDRPGRAKVTLGTGSSMMSPSPGLTLSNHGLASTVAWSSGGRTTFALEGNIAVSGHAAAFAAGLLGCGDAEALTGLAMSVADNGGVSFVPALAGLSAPHHDANARGMISGLSLSTRPGHVARATLEAIALQINDVLKAMDRDLGERLAEISVDGAASRSDVLMQLLADITGRPVIRPEITELSALGAARMAATAAGIVMPRGAGENDTRFQPEMAGEKRDGLIRQWAAAIERTRMAPRPRRPNGHPRKNDHHRAG
jgi:glycerol kinase